MRLSAHICRSNPRQGAAGLDPELDTLCHRRGHARRGRTDQRGRDLADEAIWLARVLLQVMPQEAEVRGLLALMLHCEAQRTVRRSRRGGLPL